MSFVEILIVALALAADAFSVGASVGLRHHSPRQIFRLSWHFGLFQSLLAAAGAGFGVILLNFIETWAPWVAFVILVVIGIRMIIGAFNVDENDQGPDKDLTRGRYLMGLSVAVSIDAFAAGTGLGVSHASFVLTVAMIGVVASIATLVAMLLAGRINKIIGRRAELIGGVVLILIGVKMVLV